MEYFFIPGRLKNLSFVELNSVCSDVLNSKYEIKIQQNYFLLKTVEESSFVEKIFLRLGGFLKYGIVLPQDLPFKKLVENKNIVFGISSYSDKIVFADIKKLAHKLKQEFSDLGAKVRFIMPKKGDSLSTAQILKNKLLKNGFELILFDEFFGKTLGIQDIESFACRDYDKPFVDTKMGVLPIKLARMMNNIAKVKEGYSIWDPFCGSGNILLEGLDLGFDVVGSDIDQRSLKGAKDNLQWAKKRFNYKNNAQVFYFDILNPTDSKLDLLKNIKIGGIVCEPYMGEPQRKNLNSHDANSLIKQHYSLVKNMFLILEKLNLTERINVVVIFPEYRTYKGWVSVDKNLLNFKNTELIKKDLHWSRENSIIKRLIFVFEYKSK